MEGVIVSKTLQEFVSVLHSTICDLKTRFKHINVHLNWKKNGLLYPILDPNWSYEATFICYGLGFMSNLTLQGSNEFLYFAKNNWFEIVFSYN